MMSTPKYKKTHFICCCLFLSLYAEQAKAENRSFIGVATDYLYDSNPLFRQSNVDSISGFETKAFWDFLRLTPMQSLSGRATVIRNEFNDSSFDSTDYAFNIDYTKNTPQWLASLGAGFNYDTTRTADATTLGLINRSERFLSWNVRPSLSYNVSSRTQLALNTILSENRYDSDNLTDYRILQATPTVLTQLTPQQTASFAVQTRRYTSLENRDEKVDSFGPNIGWTYQFHPRYNLQLSGGFLATKFKGFPTINEDWDYNPTYAASMNYDSEVQQASLGVTRTRQPFSNGADYDLTRINANYRLQINPDLSTTANASYEMTQDAEFSSNDLDEAWKAGIGMNYSPTPHWRFSLSQNYQDRQLLNGQDADRHIIKLGFTYSFGKRQ
jgi:hypothetical protein